MTSKLIIIRHGQSIWNMENRFAGWIDIPLSPKGIKEAKKAGKLLSEIKFDSIYTSKLERARQTLFEVLSENKHSKKYIFIHEKENTKYTKFKKRKEDANLTEIHSSEALNERYYGDLQGLNKEETGKKYGLEQLKIWRRSFNVAPPNGESLEMTLKRVLPYFKKTIVKDLKNGKTVLITAHGNSLRAISMYIEKLSKAEILEYEIPTGTPIIYEFDDKLNIKKKKICELNPKKSKR